MSKYYRVKKENFLWEVGAILGASPSSCDYMEPIEDVWDKIEDQHEMIAVEIIEAHPDYFERVYKSETEKMVFRTAEQVRNLYEKMVSEKKSK